MSIGGVFSLLKSQHINSAQLPPEQVFHKGTNTAGAGFNLLHDVPFNTLGLLY